MSRMTYIQNLQIYIGLLIDSNHLLIRPNLVAKASYGFLAVHALYVAVVDFYFIFYQRTLVYTRTLYSTSLCYLRGVKLMTYNLGVKLLHQSY